ncbi:MAG: PAS domain-containing protein [Chitinophagales bacterium]|nr:PAS domain-containing protein [Chitinophagales bacterium]
MALDVYLSALPVEEARKLSKGIGAARLPRYPLLCADVISCYGAMAIPPHLYQDLTALKNLSVKYNWNCNFSFVLRNDYEAIVVTDTLRQIIWVSRGFKKMTGYDPEYAIGKKPVFLQGPETSQAVIASIRQKLLRGEPFSEVIVNYRKDKSPYRCALRIYPICDYEKRPVAFIALEKQVA